MATGQDVIDRVRKLFPQVPPARVLEILNDVHVTIETNLDVSGTTETLSSLVSGDREYAFNTADIKIWQARYVRTSATGDYVILRPTSWDELHATNPDWIRDPAGEPEQYYIRHGVIGFDRPSPTTSAASYPQVVLDVSRFSAILVGTTMPNVPSHMAWVYGVWEELALQEKDKRLGYFETKRAEAMRELQEALERKNARYQPVVLPPGTSNAHLPRV